MDCPWTTITGCLLIAASVVGCESKASKQSSPPKATERSPKSLNPNTSPPQVVAQRAVATPPTDKKVDKAQEAPNRRTTLKDLAAAARATEFDLPQLDEGKIA